MPWTRITGGWSVAWRVTPYSFTRSGLGAGVQATSSSNPVSSEGIFWPARSLMGRSLAVPDGVATAGARGFG